MMQFCIKHKFSAQLFDCKSYTTTKLPLTSKECSFFHIHGRSSHAAQYVKSRIMNKSIDSILYIETFEQQFVVSKGMLQSPCLNDHMKTIGVDQSLCNRSSF